MSERKEAQCPFCMSTEYFDLPSEEKPHGMDVAWRGDLGPGLWAALKHKPTCPRYLACMGCGGPAITGIWGQCWDCCVKADERREKESQDATTLVEGDRPAFVTTTEGAAHVVLWKTPPESAAVTVFVDRLGAISDEHLRIMFLRLKDVIGWERLFQILMRLRCRRAVEWVPGILSEDRRRRRYRCLREADHEGDCDFGPGVPKPEGDMP